MMNRKFLFVPGILLTFLLMSFASHKFYVSIYQVEYSSEKKMLQITSRIFVDDLNAVLEKKSGSKVNFGEKEESATDVSIMKKYITDNFTIKSNGHPLAFEYLSHEYESNVIICYFRVRNLSKVKKLEITNKVLIDLVTEQQNIIQTTVNGKKKSVVLTAEHTSETIEY